MSYKYEKEIKAHLDRAMEATKAAQELFEKSYFDFAASRAYYAAFYAASALLLSEEMVFGKHSAVLGFIHKEFVSSGILSKVHGKNLNWLFELRGIGDYGVTLHVTHEDAERAIEVAIDFVKAVRALLHYDILPDLRG